MAKIAVACGWCGKQLGESNDRGVEDKTPGICNDCLNFNFPHLADLIRGYLEVENIEEIFVDKVKSQ